MVSLYDDDDDRGRSRPSVALKHFGSSMPFVEAMRRPTEWTILDREPGPQNAHHVGFAVTEQPALLLEMRVVQGVDGRDQYCPNLRFIAAH